MHDNAVKLETISTVARAIQAQEQRGGYFDMAEAAIEVVLADAEAFYKAHPNASIGAWMRSLNAR